MAKEKILVVDDEKAINKLVCSYLTKEQFRPFPAYTGEEALDLGGRYSGYCGDCGIHPRPHRH